MATDRLIIRPIKPIVQMLPKLNRLKRKKDIERVFKNGKGFKEDFLILKVAKNDLKIWRFVFVVPQKVSKKATLRNKIRRRLSELVRLKIKKIKKGCQPATTNPGLDIVIMALPGLEEKDFWEIEEVINKLFKKANLI